MSFWEVHGPIFLVCMFFFSSLDLIVFFGGIRRSAVVVGLVVRSAIVGGHPGHYGVLGDESCSGNADMVLGPERRNGGEKSVTRDGK